MIVHVFTAKRYHLVPTIAKGFATIYKDDADHLFVLNGDASLDKERYIDLFSSLDFKNYVFTQTKKQLASCLRKYKKNTIVFHAGKYYDFLIAFCVGCKHVDWVCWGGDASIPRSSKSTFSTFLRKNIYKRFDHIITLMEQDRNSIIHDYHINPMNISTLSYASGGPISRFDSLYDELSSTPLNNKEKLYVLLGNSPSNISYYMEMLPYLTPYKGKIVVHCMNNYSLTKNDKYNNLIKLGKDLFGDDFHSDEDFYAYEDYIYYMNKCDIYVCSNVKQTGLGAISNCLQLGKKIYIHGKNLEWIKGAYNATVFDTDDIKNGINWDSFSMGLSVEEKKRNLLSIRNHRKLSYEGWKTYFRNKEK